MKVVEILKIGRELLKMMSENGLRVDDYVFVGMFHEYEYHRQNKVKYSVIVDRLAEKYKVSVSTVKRVIRRLGKEAKM